ncbi:MAG: hypothetical protein Q9M36_09250 [Sulfurovum sp.]|nr:hypothetical protein [Sulfurovum sp.]
MGIMMCKFLDDCIESLSFGCLIVENKILHTCIEEVTCKNWLKNTDGTISQGGETLNPKSLSDLKNIYKTYCEGTK